MDTVFFVLSKIFYFVFSPLIWCFVLLLMGFIVKRKSLKKFFYAFSLVLLYVFSNSFLVDEVMRLWEVRPIKENKLKDKYDFIIVLGGALGYYDKKYDQIGFNQSADRVMQAIKFIMKGKSEFLIYSGGSGTLSESFGKESIILKNYLIDIGMPNEKIIIESESRNTYENAKYSAKIIKSIKQNAKVLLITSAFHMRRALACFKKQNIVCDYYPADRKSGERKFLFDHLFIPNTEALLKWEMLMHEFAGYIVYYVMGYV
ncbi:MAG: YdcF family protein [Bacteroidales bacterium]|nr:YdcF family protein [Bacteroidales bacterium]